jgi:hypothetical protein
MTPKFTFWLIVLLSALKIITIIEMSKFRPFEDELRLISPGAAVVGIIIFSSTLIFGLYGLWQYHKLEEESKGGG